MKGMQAIKNGLRDALSSFLCLMPRPRNAAVILAYHSISENGSVFAVAPAQFERQMEWLARNNFNIVSLDQLAAYRKAGAIPRKTLAITFDDGYRDNYSAALLILRRFKMPATVFIITSKIGGTWKLGADDVPLMSESELRELYDSGLFTIGAHTATHPRLPQTDQAQVARELSESKHAIESRFGPCIHFAYPHGRYTKEVRDLVAQAGFLYAYTVSRDVVSLESNDHLLGRCEIYSTTSERQFKGIVRGWGAVL